MIEILFKTDYYKFFILIWWDDLWNYCDSLMRSYQRSGGASVSEDTESENQTYKEGSQEPGKKIFNLN